MIIGQLGGVLHSKNSSELREEKYLTNVRVISIQLKHMPQMKSFKVEMDYLINLRKRNLFITKFIDQKLKGVTLIIYKRTIHGDNIYNTIKEETDSECYLINGSTPPEERESVKKRMSSGNKCIVVAHSRIFSTGISVNEIENVVFVDGGKAYITLIQSIGRGLRLHNNKSVTNIIDFSDNLEYSQQHYSKRSTIYNNEKIPVKVIEIDFT